MSWRIPQYVPITAKYCGLDDIPDLTTIRFFEIDFRRQYLAVADQVVWQYQPFPGARWETYFSLNGHFIQPGMSKKVFSAVYNSQAAEALATRRFYKVERVDAQSPGTTETRRSNRKTVGAITRGRTS